MKFVRKHYELIKHRIEESRSTIQVLVGPRQVGKSTLMEQVLNDIVIPYVFVSADAVAKNDLKWIHNIWESVRANMNVSHGDEYLLVIDEIQKIENWSEQVKLEWDSDTSHRINIKVVLLGSSRLMLMSGLKESLAGRFELIRMGHWTFLEMK